MKVDRPEPQKDVFRLDETSLGKKRTYLQKAPQITVPEMPQNRAKILQMTLAEVDQERSPKKEAPRSPEHGWVDVCWPECPSLQDHGYM